MDSYCVIRDFSPFLWYKMQKCG